MHNNMISLIDECGNMILGNDPSKEGEMSCPRGDLVSRSDLTSKIEHRKRFSQAKMDKHEKKTKKREKMTPGKKSRDDSKAGGGGSSLGGPGIPHHGGTLGTVPDIFKTLTFLRGMSVDIVI